MNSHVKCKKNRNFYELMDIEDRLVLARDKGRSEMVGGDEGRDFQL